MFRWFHISWFIGSHHVRQIQVDTYMYAAASLNYCSYLGKFLGPQLLHGKYHYKIYQEYLLYIKIFQNACPRYVYIKIFHTGTSPYLNYFNTLLFKFLLCSSAI